MMINRYANRGNLNCVNIIKIKRERKLIFKVSDKDRYKFGIYRIRNIVNDKCYIGQTAENFQKRFWHHNWKLKNNTHDNKYLQNSYNKHGGNSFVFEILDFVDDLSLLNEKEIPYGYEKITGRMLFTLAHERKDNKRYITR